jgi:hypothetical protein
MKGIWGFYIHGSSRVVKISANALIDLNFFPYSSLGVRKVSETVLSARTSNLPFILKLHYTFAQISEFS